MSDLVTVVIPAWNGRQQLPACLEALLSQQGDIEIVVVDNASSDGSADWVAERYPQVRLIRHQRNLGFAGGCNAGLQAAAGDLLVLLNQDAVVQDGWLRAIAHAARDRQVGIIGCKILEPDAKTLNHCGGALDMEAVETRHLGAGETDRGQYDQASDVEYVTGAAFALRRDVLERVGLLDDRFFPGYYEDADYCVRVRRAGLRIRYVPDAIVIHHVSTSTRRDWVRRRFYYYRNRMLFALKYFSPSEFVVRFGPSERERLSALAPIELSAVQMALYDVLACWPFWAAELYPKVTAQSIQSVSSSIQSLLGFVILQRGRHPDLAPIAPFLSQSRERAAGALDALLLAVDEMWAIWRAREPHLLSSVSSLVRMGWRLLIVGLYRVLLGRQFKFNYLIIRAVGFLAAHAWDGESTMGLLIERYGDMAQRVAQLEERLSQLESKGASHGR